MSEYIYKGNVYCSAECTIKPLTGKSPHGIGYAWDSDEVLKIIAAAMKVDPEKCHSDVFPQPLSDDTQGKCATCGWSI